MEFRKSKLQDVKDIMHIIDKAKISMKDAGIDQWQQGYPNVEVIMKDIEHSESYVALDDDKIVGTIVVTLEPELHYEDIREGQWLNMMGPYAVIHRIAVDSDYRRNGIAAYLINHAQDIYATSVDSIRIDTHQDNVPMIRTIEKMNFQLCGKVTLPDGSDRCTFEKLFQ